MSTLDIEYNNKLFEDSKYWFIRNPDSTYSIFDKELEQVLDDIVYSEDRDNFDVHSQIKIDFESRYTRSYQYLVGKHIDMSRFTIDDYIETYIKLIAGAVFIKANNIVKNSKLFSWLDWLNKGDMYTAPSSTRFHDAYESGLLIHSLNVYNQCVDLWRLDKFKSVTSESFTLVALVHDWCKIALYESYDKNVKNEVTGQWEKQKAYRWKDNGPAFPFGHGTSSMFLANRFFNISLEESLAIRWHMGLWNVADNESSDLQIANEAFPLVHMIQFADQLSIVKY